MDEPVVTPIAIEEQVSTPSGFSVELMEEDLQKWTKAYKDDKGHATMYTKLYQGQKYGKYCLTPSGLMATIMGVQQKIVFPKSLRQKIMNKCHNVTFTGHVAMRKTLELVDS